MTLPSSLLVTGATGTLGRSLLSRLSRLEEVSDVRVLSRDPARAHKALGLAAYEIGRASCRERVLVAV